MKILEPGKQIEWTLTTHCDGRGNWLTNKTPGGCGAKLEVEAGDLFITQTSAWDGSGDSYTTFQCADCGSLNDLTTAERSTIPPAIARELPTQKLWQARRRQAPA